MRKRQRSTRGIIPQVTANENTLDALLKRCKGSKDFISSKQSDIGPFYISYFKTMINPDFLHRDFLSPLKQHSIQSLQEIKDILPIENTTITIDMKEAKEKLLTGFINFQSSAASFKIEN